MHHANGKEKEDQHVTDVWAHDDCAHQQVPDLGIEVKGHDCEEAAFQVKKIQDNEGLSDTAMESNESDAVNSSLDVHHHLRDNSCAFNGISEGETREKEVHYCVNMEDLADSLYN